MEEGQYIKMYKDDKYSPIASPVYLQASILMWTK